MNNGLKAMQAVVDQSVAERIDAGSIVVAADGRSLVLSHPYFVFLARIPFFHLLSVDEQAEVLRVVNAVDFDFLARQVRFNYDNVRESENGYSYVVENLRHILALPEPDEAASVVKTLLLMSLGKMKFLSKRNADLLFVERESILKRLLSAKGDFRSMYLEDVLGLFSKMVSSDKRLFYSAKAEGLFYLQMTFVRWAGVQNLTLHEVIMMQEVFGCELSSLGEPCLSADLKMFINSFLDALSLFYRGVFDPVKILFDESVSDGVVGSTAEDVLDYMTFFSWKAPLSNSVIQKVCSLSAFKKKFSVSKLNKSEYTEFFINNVRGVNCSSKASTRVNRKAFRSCADEYYFLFCLLQGDEERFLDFVNTMVESPFMGLTEQRRYDFLSMVKEYGESDDFIPASLLLSLYGFDFLLA